MTFRQRPVRDLPAFNDILQAIVISGMKVGSSFREVPTISQISCAGSYLHEPHSGEVSVDFIDDL